MRSESPWTPIYISISLQDLIETVAPQAIYLEGTLPHESQILVSDSEERLEEEPSEEEGEGPAIILSSKMTLSLISLDKDKSSSNGKQKISRDLMAKGEMSVGERHKDNLTIFLQLQGPRRIWWRRLAPVIL